MKPAPLADLADLRRWREDARAHRFARHGMKATTLKRVQRTATELLKRDVRAKAVMDQFERIDL